MLVTCRSMLAGEFLVVEIEPAEGWHVYAMDNEARAKQALAGKMSLGVEQNTEVIVTGGLQPIGGWYQSDPLDFSQPELRWYSYGFDERSLLATKVRRGEEPWAKVTVRAQAVRQYQLRRCPRRKWNCRLMERLVLNSRRPDLSR